MDYEFAKSIIIPSLKIIRSDQKIKRFYFLPGLISVIFLSVLLVYQVVYTYVVLLGKQDAILELILQLFHSQYLTQIIIAGSILVIFHILLNPIFEGALIRYIDNKSMDWNASRSDSIGFWIVRFYPLFEFNNTFNPKLYLDVYQWELTIYNRWGELLFTSNDINNGWDGVISNGLLAPSGTYIYKIKYVSCEPINPAKEITGHINLLR